MSRLKLDQETLGLAAFMERLTHARVKDCFRDDDVIYFVVDSGDLGKALGRGGEHVRRLQMELGKRIRVIEFKANVGDFVRCVIQPFSVEEIVVQENIVLIKESSKKTKSLLIGRGSRNLHLINRAVKRFFNVDVKVV